MAAKHPDIAHWAARVGYDERLAQALARDHIRQATAEPAITTAERPRPRPRPRIRGAARTLIHALATRPKEAHDEPLVG